MGVTFRPRSEPMTGLSQPSALNRHRQAKGVPLSWISRRRQMGTSGTRQKNCLRREKQDSICVPTPQAGHVRILTVTTRAGRAATATRAGRLAVMVGHLVAPRQVGLTVKTTPAGQLAAITTTGRVAADLPRPDGNRPRCIMTATGRQ